jgi:hypothetical protein
MKTGWVRGGPKCWFLRQFISFNVYIACVAYFKTHVYMTATGLKISFTGPSDKMSDDVESDICPIYDVQFSFDSEISLNDTNEYHSAQCINSER